MVKVRVCMHVRRRDELRTRGFVIYDIFAGVG
jgi:hypothetical protein